MGQDVRHAAKVGAITALRLSGLAVLALRFVPHLLPDWLDSFGARVVIGALLALTTADLLVEGRRRSDPPLDPGEPLTMLGPVWIEHPEADAASPPRRFA